METKLPSVKQSRKMTLRSFGSNFTSITNGIYFPIRRMRKETISSVMNTAPRYKKSMTGRRINVTTCFFHGANKISALPCR